MRLITDMEDYPDTPGALRFLHVLLLQLPLQLFFVHSKGLKPPQVIFLYPVTAEAENPSLRSPTGLEKAIYITQ